MRRMILPAAVICCTMSCKEKNPEVPPVVLEDQIEFNGGTPVDIKSAVSETAEDGTVTFYLSPTAGLTDVDQMVQAADFLSITVAAADGEVDVENEDFTVSYSSLKVTRDNLDAVETMTLSADYDTEASKLVVALDIKMTDGTTLRAAYDNTCTETPEEILPVKNEYDLDGVRTPILSVIEWYDYKSSKTAYHFYSKEGLTAPEDGVAELLITVADGQSTEIDLSAVDHEALSIVCGDFSNEAATTGTLSLSKDKVSGNIVLSLKAESAGKVLEADFEGVYTRGYASRNFFSVKCGEDDLNADLSKIFLYKDAATNMFAIGLEQGAEDPAGLMNGKYAVQFSVGKTSFGQDIVLPDEAESCSFKLFAYETYTTWDINMASGSGATGTIYVAEEGDNYFVSFSLEFPDGAVTEGEWYGPATAVSETFDITPVKPFVPHITITSPDGAVLAEWTVAEMELRLEKDYKLRGGDPQYGGSTFDAYFFYFRPVDNSNSVEDAFYIPQIMFKADGIPTDGELDLAAATDANWYLKFQRSELKKTQYSENYSMGSSTYFMCPDDVKINVKQNEDKTWDFSFSLVDYGSYASYNPDLKEGTKNKIVIEWKGAATKYTGTKTNDLQDSDY